MFETITAARLREERAADGRSGSSDRRLTRLRDGLPQVELAQTAESINTALRPWSAPEEQSTGRKSPSARSAKPCPGAWGAGETLAGAWGAGETLAGAWGAGETLPGRKGPERPCPELAGPVKPCPEPGAPAKPYQGHKVPVQPCPEPGAPAKPYQGHKEPERPCPGLAGPVKPCQEHKAREQSCSGPARLAALWRGRRQAPAAGHALPGAAGAGDTLLGA